jgi:hypothetical protein
MTAIRVVRECDQRSTNDKSIPTSTARQALSRTPAVPSRSKEKSRKSFAEKTKRLKSIDSSPEVTGVQKYTFQSQSFPNLRKAPEIQDFGADYEFPDSKA